ncbi:helix-turn-helix domain-containing protein [Glutamicibacter halophytocola]|uniref:helix-turn-helix domain-containing protein n=1 Tax=Glutamicibacter halophytocola TaxID=1933880 RepID=UPI0032197316
MKAGTSYSGLIKATARWEILRQHVEDGVPLTVLAEEHHIGLRTLQRWHQSFKLQGKPGLEPVAQGKRGRRMPSDFVKLVEGLALAKLPRTTAAIHQQANKVALHQGWAPVSYSTIRSIVGEIDPGMMTLAQARRGGVPR